MRLLRSSSPTVFMAWRGISISSHSASSAVAILRRSPRVKCWRFRLDRRGSGGLLIVRSADFGDDDFGGVAPSFHDVYGEMADGRPLVMSSSSEGEESDAEIVFDPNLDLEMSASKDGRESPKTALAVAAHRIAALRGGRRRDGIMTGVWLNVALFSFLAVILLFVDWCSWRIVRLPLEPFYFSRPFCLSAAFTTLTGYLYVPLARWATIHHLQSKRPKMGLPKREPPSMGGLFFIPISLLVSGITTQFSSAEVFGAGVITLVFLVIGLLEDVLSIDEKKSHWLSGCIKFTLQIAAGTCFSLWFSFSETSSCYNMKFLVPLPQPLGLVYLGKLYLPLTAFCFLSMGNGVNLTDSLDGVAGGISALAFIGMSIAVLPVNPELSIFGASMAGACAGFLVHNRFEASVSMGHSGSSALGGALAAMAASSGMFFPLLICSAALLLELFCAVVQVFCCVASKIFSGAGGKFVKTVPFHQILKCFGFGESAIVAWFYVVSSIFCMLAGYVGLCIA
ncbi:translocase 11 isoform X2 [Wolffia australiana]